ncbi:MAG: hypothetical protein E5X12_00800, partial [Mesorhizobium sp.]
MKVAIDFSGRARRPEPENAVTGGTARADRYAGPHDKVEGAQGRKTMRKIVTSVIAGIGLALACGTSVRAQDKELT